MRIDVIEFELVCPEHGMQKTIVPVQLPWPKRCVHCFLPLSSRRELRRFPLDGPFPSDVPSEAWIG